MVMLRLLVSRPILALVWVVAMAWSSATFAQVYKWVDQKGVTNYSGTPPATAKARTLDLEATTVSVYQTTAPQDAARLDALMRQKVAMLENELQAERLARQTQQASYRTDAGLAYEQCLRERRVDCDAGYAGTFAAPYFYAAAPVYVPGQRFPFRPVAPFKHTPPFATIAGFPRPAGGSVRTAGHRGSSRKF